MPKVRSVFEYDAIPFNKVDLSTPVTQIMEMNDGYQIVVAGELRESIHESDSQFDRGGIQVNEFDSLRDFLLEECGGEEDENGELVFEDETLEQVLARMTNDGDPFMGDGLIMIKKLSGTYRDPETLFMSFFEGEEDDEDEDEVLCEEDCA